MAKPKPPPPPQPRAGDVVCLRQSPEYVEGEIIAVLDSGRYRVKWETGVDYRDWITTIMTDEIRRSRSSREVGTVSAICIVWGIRPRSCLTRYLGGLTLHLHAFCDEQEERQMWRPDMMPSHGPVHPD